MADLGSPKASLGFAGLGRNETQSGGLKWPVLIPGPHRNSCSVRPGPEWKWTRFGFPPSHFGPEAIRTS
jgi:hypothetical protein